MTSRAGIDKPAQTKIELFYNVQFIHMHLGIQRLLYVNPQTIIHCIQNSDADAHYTNAQPTDSVEMHARSPMHKTRKSHTVKKKKKK